MSKKIRVLLVTLIFVTIGAGCKPPEDYQSTIYDTVTVYRRRSLSDEVSGSAINAVEYEVYVGENNLHKAMSLLFEKTESDYYSPVFPEHLRLNGYSVNEGCLSVELSGGYAEMKGTELALARSCLVLTACSISGISSVDIYESGRCVESGLTTDLILLESVGSGYSQTITLYYPNSDYSRLLSERRQLTIVQDKLPAEFVVEELINSGRGDRGKPAVPEGTRLLGLRVAGGLCTVDFSSEFYTNRPLDAKTGRMMIYSVVNTLTELSGVDAVLFSCEGERIDEYAYMRLSTALHGEPGFVNKNGADLSENRVNVCLGTADGEGLVLVNLPVTDITAMKVYTAIETCLSLENTWGYKRLIPDGTELVAVETDDKHCTVELTRKYLSNYRTDLSLAAQSIAAMVWDSAGIESVRIMVDGKQYGDITHFDKDLLVT